MNAERLATANPLRLLGSIQGQASERKLRLLGCACCRVARHRMVRNCLPSVAVAERFADGLATADQLRRATETEYDPEMNPALRGQLAYWIVLPDAFEAARYALGSCLEFDKGEFWLWDRQKRWECRNRYNRLLADVFDPLLSRPVPFDADWKTSTSVTLAQQMYDSRDFSAMPILADALQDAGCENADILHHCRDPEQPHIRGCWVIDQVLGKE